MTLMSWDLRDSLICLLIVGEGYGQGGRFGLGLSVELFKGEFVRVL